MTDNAENVRVLESMLRFAEYEDGRAALTAAIAAMKGEDARAAVEASQPAASVIERAAKYGWRHSSWDWDSVRIGLEQFAPPAPKAEAVEGQDHVCDADCDPDGDLTRALAESGWQGDLVEEGLRYFELSGDAGDKRYVAAIRAALTRPQPIAAVTEAGEKASVLAAIKFLRPEYEAWSDTRKVAFDRITTAALSQGVAHPSAAVTEAMVTIDGEDYLHALDMLWRELGNTNYPIYRKFADFLPQDVADAALSQGGKP